MSQPEQPPRPSAAIGAVIRGHRAGRYTIAELAQRSGVSSGLLSLIERGRGNPSLETLNRIAAALDLAVVELLVAAEGASSADATGLALAHLGGPDDRLAGVVLDQPPDGTDPFRPTAAGWQSSMILGRGQEARVRVLEGSLELLLRDAQASLPVVDGRPPLAVDLELRTSAQADVDLEIPAIDDPRWLRLATGGIPFQPTTVAARMLFTHVTRCIRHDPSSPNVDRWVSELRGYFVKYEAVSKPELKQIFG
jgi:transcriptional regulator with XRE-family HTH domain